MRDSLRLNLEELYAVNVYAQLFVNEYNRTYLKNTNAIKLDSKKDLISKVKKENQFDVVVFFEDSAYTRDQILANIESVKRKIFKNLKTMVENLEVLRTSKRLDLDLNPPLEEPL